ncbi:MAG: TIM barrel protein [Pirellula sp.]
MNDIVFARGENLPRRSFLRLASAGLSAACMHPSVIASQPNAPTRFQIACMTLPYNQFPLKRALQGIKSAGFNYVAWGTTHRESDSEKNVPVMPADGTTDQAKSLANRCRDMGLEPSMMFSMVYPEHADGPKVLTQRLKQAGAAGIPQVLTFGHTQGGNRKLWVERLKQLGPIARDLGVLLVVKQHGGETGTGAACAEITREVNDAGVKVNYDAGNVMDYLNVDPIPDILKCADEVRSLCMKDHRNWPKDEDCAPGLGEIDHYRLMDAVAFTGLTMPLCLENISSPLLPKPTAPEQIDQQARWARLFLETVLGGLHSPTRFGVK